jgi:tetratricopeptide (TPR) repeat protein
LKRLKERIERQVQEGFAALAENDAEAAERHFRIAGHTLGIALACYHGRFWERATSKALAALAQAGPGTEDEAVALKVLAIASKQLGEEKKVKGAAQQRREALIKRAEERLDGVEWGPVHGLMRELAKKQPAVYGALASVRMGRKMVKAGFRTIVDFVLAGDYHRAACLGDDLTRIEATTWGLAAEFSLCPDCLEEWFEPAPGEPPNVALNRLSALTGTILFEFTWKSPEHALILGISALHFAEFRARHGEDVARLVERAQVYYDAAAAPQSLAPEEAGRWTACVDYHRGRVLELGKNEAAALALVEKVAAGPAAPWNDRAREVAERIRRRQASEAKRARVSSLRGECEAARKRSDDEAELAAMKALSSEIDLELGQLERLSRLRDEDHDPGWTDTAIRAAAKGSHDENLSRRLGDEAAVRWSEGKGREALNLFILARRIAPLSPDVMSACAAVLASFGRNAEAAKAYAAVGHREPIHFLESARCFMAAGEEKRAVAVVQALFVASDAVSLWEEGLRLVESHTTPPALRLLARLLLDRQPENEFARTALARAEAEAYRAAVEERERVRAVARGAAKAGDWPKVRDSLQSVQENVRDGELWTLLARAHESLGEAEESLRCYEAMSQTAASVAGRARSLIRLRRFEDARETLERLRARLEPEEEPELGSDPDVKGLWAEVKGDLQLAARLYVDEAMLRSLIMKAREREDALAELEALSVIAARDEACVGELMERVRALEGRLPVRAKARIVRDRMPALILCDTNVLLSKVLEGVPLPDVLQALRSPRGVERFEALRSQRGNVALAVTDTVAGELRSVLKYQMAVREDEESEKALEEVMRRAEQLVSELHVEKVAGLSPRPPPEYSERVRSFYRSMGPRLRAITRRKVSRRPERSSEILGRRGVSKDKPGRAPMPEAVDQRLLAEAASLVDGPLPGFGGVGILSDDADFRSFAREIETTFGVRIH